MFVAPSVGVRRSRALVCAAGVLALVSISTWLFAAERHGVIPPGNYVAATLPDWPLTEAHATTLRNDALRRAAVRLDAPGPLRRPRPAYSDPLDDEIVSCRYLRDDPTGTSAKFNCVLPDGELVKVKYGRNPEIHAEVAGSALITALGFPADEMHIVPRLRCFGCPRFSFLAMQLLWLTSSTGLLSPHGHEDAFTEFEWVAVERKFPAPAIEAGDTKGWAWWEIGQSNAPLQDLDALRLVAIFLAHWDNKSQNQRLVCLDDMPTAPDQPCSRPLAMIQDVGSTFGPIKMNVARWRELSMWTDRRNCTVSMRAMPFGGGTFPETHISEAGRIEAVRLFAAMDDDAVRRLFADARFPDFYSPTDDKRDLDAWAAAFRYRVDQLAMAGPCPAPGKASDLD